MRTKRQGEATVCGNCGNARWTVTRCEEGSQFVDFECICSKCGSEPDLQAMNKLCIGRSGVVHYSGYAHEGKINLCATHLFCGRCFKEDRGKSRHQLEELKDKWVEINYTSTCFHLCITELHDSVVLCIKCSKKADLIKWIQETQFLKSSVKLEEIIPK